MPGITRNIMKKQATGLQTSKKTLPHATSSPRPIRSEADKPKLGKPSSTEWPCPRGSAVPMELLRANVLQLQSVDHMTQTFMARLFIQLRIPGGANDVDLIRDLDYVHEEPPFPKDTLRPGASWFLRQLDFPTALDYTILERKVVKLQEHLDLVIKVTGTFFEHMELEDFPVRNRRRVDPHTPGDPAGAGRG